nr:alpha-L-fucosidase C-terminal domain-containing protein [Pedobacter kyonggii]
MNPITKIRTLEPILFYSGKQDELQIFLNEAEYGELIIKSLSHDQIRVKAVMLGEAGEKLNWKQDYRGLSVSVPETLVTIKKATGRVVKITF